MTLNKKKEQILRFVKTGMALYESALLAECTEDEIELLEQDDVLVRRVRFEHAREEQRLLGNHNTAMDIAMERGNASPIQWRLERLNPRRWGAQNTEKDPYAKTNVNVNLIGVSADGARS